jgi:hypothetical protein
VARRKKISQSQQLRLAASCQHALTHMSRVLQVFLEIGDQESAMKVKKSMLSVSVVCKRKTRSPEVKTPS